MSATTARFAWANAERRCFDYLTARLSAGSDATGYLAEFPRKAATPTDFAYWMFEAQGGGDVVAFPPDAKPWSSWRINATLRAVCTDRRTAQEIAGLVRDALPAGPEQIEGVARLRMVSEPTLMRDVMQVDSDQETGGEIIVWKLDMPLEMVFGNTEPALE